MLGAAVLVFSGCVRTIKKTARVLPFGSIRAVYDGCIRIWLLSYRSIYVIFISEISWQPSINTIISS